MCSILHRRVTKLYVKSWNEIRTETFQEVYTVHIAMAVEETGFFCFVTHFGKPQTLTYTFSESSSNGKEAFWLAVDFWVWKGRIESTNHRMSWANWDYLQASRWRKGWVHSPLEVDRWGSCYVSATQQRAKSWYWGSQACPHHCICRWCVRGIWTVCDAATSRWRDSRWIPWNTRKNGSLGGRKTTWKMDSLRICCWVATACQAAALGISANRHFDIRLTQCESSSHSDWGS